MRVKEGLENYESQMNKVQSAMKDIQTGLKEESESPIILFPHSQLQNKKEKLQVFPLVQFYKKWFIVILVLEN